MEYEIISAKALSATSAECRFSNNALFYLRTDYLVQTPADMIYAGSILDQEQFDDCMQAGLAYAAERCAMEYLNRSEHSRSQLYAKMAKKEHSQESCNQALDYLENCGFLDDGRFARAFLRNRSISHTEGRSRLLSELVQRGVKKQTAQEAVEEFFADKDENELLEKAAKKLVRTGKKPEAMHAALIRLGFSSKAISEYFKEKS